MRWVFSVVVIVVAVLVAGRYFHWSWTDPATYTGQESPVAGSGGTCGRVADVYFARNSRGQPTFVDFGAPHPHEDFTVVIWGDDRPNFNPPPESWQGKKVCITGKVTHYHGRPEIVAHAPDQIRVSPN